MVPAAYEFPPLEILQSLIKNSCGGGCYLLPEVPFGCSIHVGELDKVGDGRGRFVLWLEVCDHSWKGEMEASERVGEGGASANSITPRKYDSRRLFLEGGSRSLLSINPMSRRRRPCDMVDVR